MLFRAHANNPTSRIAAKKNHLLAPAATPLAVDAAAFAAACNA